MNLRRFLFTLFALALAPSLFGPSLFAQSTAKTFTLNAANQCATIGVSGYSTVGIQVTGTFSATLQPEVSIAGQSPQNSQVTPSNSNTAQSTITTTGAYVASVGGYDTFLVCVSAYTSGTATVWLNPSKGVNASLFGVGGGGGSSLPPQTLPGAAGSIVALIALGDSINYPRVGDPLQQWPFYLSAVGNMTVNDLAQPSSGLAEAGPVGLEQITYAYQQSPSTTTLIGALLGANDASEAGATGGFAALQQGYAAMAAWSAIPSTSRTVVASGNCTGSWTSISEFGINLEISTTVGDVCTMTASGTTIYVVGIVGTGVNQCQESITIDGNVVFSGALPTAYNALSPYLFRFPGLAPGSHTILFKPISAGVRAVLQWVGGNVAGAGYPFAMGQMIPRSGITGGETTRTTMNAGMATVASQLAADGLSVYLVPDASVVSLTAVPAQYENGGVHPNLRGRHMLGAFWAYQFFPFNEQSEAQLGDFLVNTGNSFSRGAVSLPNTSSQTVTVSANVSTDQNLFKWIIPLALVGNQFVPPTVTTPAILPQQRTFHCFIAGVYTTPAANLSTLEFKAKLCTVSGCATGTVQPLIDITSTANPGTVTNDPWYLEFWATTGNGDTGSAAQFESHGTLKIDLGAATTGALSEFGDQNTAVTTPSVDTANQLYMQATVAFSSASASNSVTQRQQICEIVGP